MSSFVRKRHACRQANENSVGPKTANGVCPEGPGAELFTTLRVKHSLCADYAETATRET